MTICRCRNATLTRGHEPGCDAYRPEPGEEDFGTPDAFASEAGAIDHHIRQTLARKAADPNVNHQLAAYREILLSPPTVAPDLENEKWTWTLNAKGHLVVEGEADCYRLHDKAHVRVTIHADDVASLRPSAMMAHLAAIRRALVFQVEAAEQYAITSRTWIG
jgi:hypothetical protein